jgi:hypothetical protein
MPMSVNVGLSKKASRDYQSTGVSINVTAELDSALLAKPDELQQQIDGLYAQAENAIARQVRRSAADAPSASRAPVRQSTNGDTYRRNGSPPTHVNGSRHAGAMTESQRRAIESIARRAGLDPNQEAQELMGVPFDQLTLRQASELIDALKQQAPATNGRH